jgi:hypothetical protein
MTDAQLQQRANLYARQAMIQHSGKPVLTRDLLDEAVEAEVVTLIARAFVVGFAAGLEDGHKLGREARVRGSK